jgi:hypothetical protein
MYAASRPTTRLAIADQCRSCLVMRTGDGDTNVTPVQKSIGSNRLRCRCVTPGSGVFVVE